MFTGNKVRRGIRRNNRKRRLLLPTGRLRYPRETGSQRIGVFGRACGLEDSHRVRPNRDCIRLVAFCCVQLAELSQDLCLKQLVFGGLRFAASILATTAKYPGKATTN